jgi:hypothetical protein
MAEVLGRTYMEGIVRIIARLGELFFLTLAAPFMVIGLALLYVSFWHTPAFKAMNFTQWLDEEDLQ